MDFKTFFVKKVLMSFFISTTCICAAMAVVGMIYEPDTRFGYAGLLSPLIWGALAALPQFPLYFISYSKKEPTFKQAIIRNLIHLLLIEAVILFILYSLGSLTGASITAALSSAILIIYITVHLVSWVNDSITAREFNWALKTLQNNAQKEKNDN